TRSCTPSSKLFPHSCLPVPELPTTHGPRKNVHYRRCKREISPDEWIQHALSNGIPLYWYTVVRDGETPQPERPRDNRDFHKDLWYPRSQAGWYQGTEKDGRLLPRRHQQGNGRNWLLGRVEDGIHVPLPAVHALH